MELAPVELIIPDKSLPSGYQTRRQVHWKFLPRQGEMVQYGETLFKVVSIIHHFHNSSPTVVLEPEMTRDQIQQLQQTEGN